ncbi:MAG: hypothetical protein KDJ31_13735 [Candidatus Competibacteraceae bacterium]|nr:hypothetical protein [Candidatus Competibacteraceae bacterium]MCB1820421.1 hypothetical protein [Candidatus Competibacteraceae bacterium]
MPKVQINCWLPPEAATRLKALSQQHKRSYGDVLTGLLLAAPEPEPHDWLSAIAAIEQRLSTVEQSLSVASGDSGQQVYARLAWEDQAVWKQRIRELHAQNIGYRSIAKVVYEEGLTGQDGLPLASSTITRICKA